jgi:hypothetical protein
MLTRVRRDCATACRKMAATRRENQSFATSAPALPQHPQVFIGWMLGMANGPMRAYTSFGTP